MRPYLLLLSGLLACKGPVRGEIDGQTVEIGSVLFLQETQYYETGDGEIQVWLTGVEDACQVMEGYTEDLRETADAGDRAALWQDTMPEDFWAITLLLRVDDPRGDLEDLELAGTDWGQPTTGADEVQGLIMHYEEWLDEDFYQGTTTGQDYMSQFFTDNGTLTIRRNTPDEEISATFEARVVNAEGEEEGEVTMDFTAPRCRGLEKYFY